MLWPKGSGTAEAPIALTAWGDGPLPKLQSGPAFEAALKLFNQEYWEIENLELIGGQPHGLFVSGDRGVLHHIYVKNLVVHGVTGEPLHKEDGLVAITPGAVEQRFDDVLVDGVTAYDTSQWAGILVGGGNFGYPPESTRSTNVIVRNSIVHDVQGDGIILFRVNRGLIENCAAWHTGMQLTQTIGTPNAIWTWMCRDCTVRRSEAFLTDSPGVDGGAFDIDFGNDNNTVEESYGHDTQGYCVAVFGAAWNTTNSVVRNNVCAANGRSPRLALGQGAVYLSTWDGGKLNGVRIENNRIEWNPPIAAPVLVNKAQFSGPGSFENNVIRSTSPIFVSSTASLKMEQNTFESMTRAAGPRPGGIWELRYYHASRGQITILKSALEQFRASGLQVGVTVERDPNLRYDWSLGDMLLLSDGPSAASAVLIAPDGKTVWHHEGFVPPADLGLMLRAFLGEPDYARMRTK